ncbi:hypothetical protein F2Q69_00030849 [Brassica cretica]|uniref:Uncharacterized protein n=1 Tax=Brassica cretica TaxID=69181 RepID=A0A8S9RZ63_BRACR|nr:hypothetical protein F2Q69_00030849 [Brassica cretica]
MEETGGSVVGMGWLAKLSPPPRTVLLAALIPAAARASRWQIWWTTIFSSSVAKGFREHLVSFRQPFPRLIREKNFVAKFSTN